MITSTSNQQMKNLAQLLKKGKVRREQDVFVVEGMKMYLEAPKDRVKKTYVAKSLYEKDPSFWEGEKAEVVEDRVFQSVSDTKTPQGVLSLIEQFHYQPEDLWKKPCPQLLILENLQDPGNLGTIVRTVEGAGADGILMSRDTVDIYNPKVIRSTMGSIYRMPFCYVEDLKESLEALKKKGVTVYAAHLKGKVSYEEMDYRKGTAFLIGNEGNGLTEETADLADAYIRIPMCGQVESLNAAVASSILMYEVLRQRRMSCNSSAFGCTKIGKISGEYTRW